MRCALWAVATDTTGEIGVVRDALLHIGVTPDALVSAEAAGALVFADDRVAFVAESHRTKTMQAMPAIERRKFHRALAAALTAPRHRLQRAEHLAAAAVGPDHDAATALADLGRDASARGDTAGAGELYMRAAGLSPDPEDRATRLYHAADGYWNAGEYTAARAAFDAAYIGSQHPILRADIALQLGQLDMYQRGPRFSRDLFVAASEAVEPHDVDRAAMLLVHAASTTMLSSDIVGALPLVRRASELASRGGGVSSVAASLMGAFLSFQHGDSEEFDSAFEPLSQIADELKDSDITDVDLFLQLVGMLHVYTEHWDTGRAFLSAVVHRAGRRARFATVALASATLAELCWRSGRWDEAWQLATSSVVTEVTLTGARLWLLSFTAHLAAGLGRADECRDKANAALAEAEPMGFGTATVWSYHALGLLELGLGRPVAAAAHLDRLDAIATSHEMFEPSGIWWQADHVEALTRSGRHREALRAMTRFERGAAGSGLEWAAATTARCRGLMAAPDDAERWFAESLDHHDHLAAPFELARTLLCRAESRIATKSDIDPSADLAEAIAIFDGLGAVPWSAQARSLSDTIVPTGEVSLELLSPAERRVAEAVLSGLTNREVAATLYISDKTVEFHLHNVYRKLGLRSRTQLVLLFGR